MFICISRRVKPKKKPLYQQNTERRRKTENRGQNQGQGLLVMLQNQVNL